jgi:peptide/nickel transport system permease protein
VSQATAEVAATSRRWRRFHRNPTAAVGLAIVALVVLAAIFAPWISPYPDHVGAVVNFRARHQPPSAHYWLGTDNVGRDILTRVLFGYRISLILAATVLIFAVPVGVVLGLLAGYFGGWTETIIMRANDIALAIPPLVMALAVTTVLTPSLVHSMLAIAALWWTWHTRLIFSIVRTLRQQEFVEAAKTLGASPFHILFRELLPNCASAILVKTSASSSWSARRSHISASACSRRRLTSGPWWRAAPTSCPSVGGSHYFPAPPSWSPRSASICSATACATSSTSRASDERRAAARRRTLEHRFRDRGARRAHPS